MIKKSYVNLRISHICIHSKISGKFYLVDCEYANRHNFLVPYRSTRYHLQDFRGQGKDPVNQNELFNHRHSSLRNVIERIFGIFKSRFPIFKCAPPFPYKTQAELVLACVVLHNYLRKECVQICFFLNKLLLKKVEMKKKAKRKTMLMKIFKVLKNNKE